MLRATPTRRKGSQNYEVRIRVPPRLRAALGIEGTHTTRSLKTNCYREAVRRTGEVLRELEKKAGAVKAAAPTPNAGHAEEAQTLSRPLPATRELCNLYRAWKRREILEYGADITQLHYEDKARLLRGDLLPLPPETVVEDLRHSPYNRFGANLWLLR